LPVGLPASLPLDIVSTLPANLPTNILVRTVFLILMLQAKIKSLFASENLLSFHEIVERLGNDRGRVSGYLEAMVDYGELIVKKVGNSKVYYLKDDGGS